MKNFFRRVNLHPQSNLGELDLHLIGEGRHENLWSVLGAHVKRDSSGELLGTTFSVWAPNAKYIGVIGDHNFWNPRANPMVRIGKSGIWEIFIPLVGPGEKYKFAIEGADGKWIDHADPMARATETPPHTASIVDESQYIWSDNAWMENRANYQPWRSPISVYEVHIGSWRPGLSYQQLAEELTQYVLSLIHI